MSNDGRLYKLIKELRKEAIKNPEHELGRLELIKLTLDEATRGIPLALIYGTHEQLEGGYCHDDVWIMMDWIKDFFGSLEVKQIE